MALAVLQPGGGQLEHGRSVQPGLLNAFSLLENHCRQLSFCAAAAVAECKNNTCVFVNDNVMGVCFVRRQ